MNFVLFAVLLAEVALPFAVVFIEWRKTRRNLLLLAAAGLALEEFALFMIFAVGWAAFWAACLFALLSIAAMITVYVQVRRSSLILGAIAVLVGIATFYGVSGRGEYAIVGFIGLAAANVLGVIALLGVLSRNATPNGEADRSSRLSIFAVLALTLGILIAPLGIVFGHLALVEIRRTGDRGRGLAIAGLIVGYGWILVLTITAVVLSQVHS